MKINDDYVKFMDSKNGAVTSQEIFEAGIEAGMNAERKRCADIVQLARDGEIDGDFRSIIHRIKDV